MPFEFKAWLSQRLGRDEAPAPASTASVALKRADEPYHAVSIKPGEDCCVGAKQFAKVRFLSARAPRLPLPDCTAAVCNCRYVHHADRRAGRDRRIGENWRRGPNANIERRDRKQGRRATDTIT